MITVSPAQNRSRILTRYWQWFNSSKIESRTPIQPLRETKMICGTRCVMWALLNGQNHPFPDPKKCRGKTPEMRSHVQMNLDLPILAQLQHPLPSLVEPYLNDLLPEPLFPYPVDL
jgi:hypothetical protein